MSSDLDSLEQKIKEARHAHESEAEKAGHAGLEPDENMNTGLRAGAELTGAILAGALIGWGLDQWLGTKPWMLIVFLLLGVATGFVNVWRITNNIGTQIGYSELHRRQKLSRTLPDEKTD